MTTWKQLLSNREVKKHSTSSEEVKNLFSLVERDLKDASIKELSPDRRFATAYNAALQLCKLVIACSGYRVSSSAHHQKTFEIAEFALGKSVADFISYFEYCRRKRNMLDYDLANVVSESEADELYKKVKDFFLVIKTWLDDNYSELI